MKRIKTSFTILILFGVLFSSCESRRARTNDYSVFQQGAILSGNMKDGNTCYLIREDSVKMSGFCFVDNNQAVVEPIPFFADSTGATVFIYGSASYAGKMIVNHSTMAIELTLPDISALEIERQTIHLNYSDRMSKRVDCLERFKNPVFETIIATKDIQYGTARGYYNSKPSDYISNDDYAQWFAEMFKTYRGTVIEQGMIDLPLYLDIYHPDNDNLKQRPLVLFIHGGAFFFGDKENKMQQALTDYLVKRGFIVASINYRLGSTLLGTAAIERAIYRNVQDARAALRYLVNHKDRFGIDDRQIYLAGSSAGGIIALTTAFMDNNEVYTAISEGILNMRQNLGGLDDSGNDLIANFNVAGVVSMWGGITDLKMLDNPVPTLLFHGTNDDIIPYDKGLPFKKYMGNFVHGLFSSSWQIYGSELIYNRLKSLNMPTEYVPFHGFGHEACMEPDGTLNKNMDVICDETGNFLFDNVSKQYFDYHLSGNTNVRKHDPVSVYTLDNVENASVQWHVEGGFITQQTNEVIRVIWFSTHEKGTVTACITDVNGVSCRKELNVRINS